MNTAADTAVVMATHNGQAFLTAQLESILAQTHLPAVLVIVDDGSHDATRDIIGDFAGRAPFPIRLLPLPLSSEIAARNRIARAMSLGLASVNGHAFILLADQDDEWLPDRLDRQRDLLSRHAGALLVAGDGLLIDGAGGEIGGTLRDHFPVPTGWSGMDAARRMAAALGQSFVTGATCALRAELVPMLTPVPDGWLLDRWATLVATARAGLLLHDEPVIRYRIHPDQDTGIRGAAVERGQQRWRQVLARGTSVVGAGRRARDVVERIRPLAIDPAVRRQLSWPAIVRGAFQRSDRGPARLGASAADRREDGRGV